MANVSRRTVLRSAGVALSLPLLDSLRAAEAGERSGRAAAEDSPRRLVFVCASLGLHGPHFFPAGQGRSYRMSPYLKLLEEHRNDFTVYSGLSHPDQAGGNGHASERTWLTAAPHPGMPGFRNSISVDQWAAEQLGYQTRFPSLVLGTDGASQSYTRSGVMIPAQIKPSRVFTQLFLAGSEREVREQQRKLAEGRSILDRVAREAKLLAKRSSRVDRQRLAEYFESVRDAERKLEAAEAWVKRPKPQVTAPKPVDVQDDADIIGRAKLLFDLVPLALQTDSTRVITIFWQGRNDVPAVDGVEIDHHNLSHHGQDERKLEQLERVERAQLTTFAELLRKLGNKQEGGERLLDSTSILFGSNLGNANSHDTTNLPILVAGGPFKHGTHQRFNAKVNTPLCNLFVAMLQAQGHDVDAFGSSTGYL